MIVLALLLVVGAMGVVFYSIGQWKQTFSQSIVPISTTVNATAEPKAIPVAPSTNPSSDIPLDIKQIRAGLLNAGVDAKMLEQVNDEQLRTLYQQFKQKQAPSAP